MSNAVGCTLLQVDNINDSEEVPVNAPSSEEVPVNAPSSEFSAAPHQADCASETTAAPINEPNEPGQMSRLVRAFSGFGLFGGREEPSATTFGENMSEA